MLKTIYLLSAILLSSSLCAQTRDNSNSNEEEVITRTLRIIIAGNRRMPEFKVVGDRQIEVDPPLEKLPPSSFQFEDPEHAPEPQKGKTAKIKYSARANSLVTIQNYTGPATLQLKLRRPTLPKYKNQLIQCNLGDSINPLIIIHPSASSRGWKSPESKVINIAKPTVGRGATVVNLTELTIQAMFFDEKTLLKGFGYKNVVIPTSKTTANKVKYKVQAYDPKIKQSIIVANSNYRMKKKTQLVVITMPGLKKPKVKIVRPNIRIIPVIFK